MGMTGRERTLAAIGGEPVDRVPVAQHNFPFVARRAGLSMRAYRSDARVAAQALADAADDLGYDCIIHDVDTASLAEAMGAGVVMPEAEPARVERPAVASIAAIRDLPLPDPARDGRLPFWLEVTRELRARVGDRLAILGRADQGPFGLAFLLMDSQEFLMDLLETDDDVVQEALAHCAEAGARFARAQLDAGADLSSIGDSAAGQSVVSPDVYRNVARPAERGYRDLVGEGRLSLHICGKTDAIVADMADTGFDVFELDQENDLDRTFATLHALGDRGRRVCVYGNVDPSSVLYRGTPDDVERACRSAIETARRYDARFVLCSGCVMMANTPEANARAMVRAAAWA
jgi:MtaA/CmuA family methyltransferase